MDTRQPLIAGNWKMYKTGPEAVETAKRLRDLASDVKTTDIMIAPTFTAIAQVADILKGSSIATGAQNLYWEKEGAYTGEISPSMLISAGCSYVIIGHSERRQFFGETDEKTQKKVDAAVKEGLKPILCVGESLEERESDKTFSVLDKQIEIGLKDLFSENLNNLVIAYEPIWAIGTGKTASKDQAQDVHRHLRSGIEKNFGKDFSKGIRILYGGSVKPDNISELMAMPDIDGALVGGASLDAETFSKIVHF